jgi:hypothetical protein
MQPKEENQDLSKKVLEGIAEIPPVKPAPAAQAAQPIPANAPSVSSGIPWSSICIVLLLLLLLGGGAYYYFVIKKKSNTVLSEQAPVYNPGQSGVDNPVVAENINVNK